MSALYGTGATHWMSETAAKILASSATELLTTPGLLEQAKAEFEERLQTRCEDLLIPHGLKPLIDLCWPEWVGRPRLEWWIPSTRN